VKVREAIGLAITETGCTDTTHLTGIGSKVAHALGLDPDMDVRMLALALENGRCADCEEAA